MVAVTSGKILVTGGTGFIGAWVIKDLVDCGYTVRASVRKQSQGEVLVNSFPEYQGKVTYEVIPDIVKDGAFDEAVKDVDGVVHVASPVLFVIKDPSEVLGPAVDGTLSLYTSVQRFGSKVKRIILTGSVSAVVPNYQIPGVYPGILEPPHVFTEADWNEVSPALVEKEGKQVSPWHIYCYKYTPNLPKNSAAKVHQERAAWKFIKENETKFDMTSILPSYVWGSWIHHIESRETLGSSPGVFFSTFNTDTSSPEVTGQTVSDYVHARDIAHLHTLALQTEAAGGERIIAANGAFSFQDIYDILNDAGYGGVPKGTYGAGSLKQHFTFNNKNSLRIFPGFSYRPFDQAIKDMGESFRKAGWLD